MPLCEYTNGQIGQIRLVLAYSEAMTLLGRDLVNALKDLALLFGMLTFVLAAMMLAARTWSMEALVYTWLMLVFIAVGRAVRECWARRSFLRGLPGDDSSLTRREADRSNAVQRSAGQRLPD